MGLFVGISIVILAKKLKKAWFPDLTTGHSRLMQWKQITDEAIFRIEENNEKLYGLNSGGHEGDDTGQDRF